MEVLAISLPLTIQDTLRRTERFLRLRLATRRACIFLLISAIAAVFACPVLWLLSVPGTVGITAGALCAATAMGIASALVWPSRSTVKTAAAVFLDRELRLDDRVLSILDSNSGTEHGCTMPGAVRRHSFELLLLRETEAALCSPAAGERCKLSPPRLLRYCAAAVVAWTCVAILGETFVLRAAGKNDDRMTTMQAMRIERTGDVMTTVSSRSAGRASSVTDLKDSEAGASETRVPSASAAGSGDAGRAPFMGTPTLREDTKNADLSLAIELASVVGFTESLEDSKDADSFIAFVAKTIAEASPEEKQRLFKALAKAIGGRAEFEDVAAVLRHAAESDDAVAFCESLERCLRRVLAQADGAGDSGAGANAGAAGSGGITGHVSDRRVGVPPTAASPAHPAITSSEKVFDHAAVRERTERALREANWPPRADGVVRRFFTE